MPAPRVVIAAPVYGQAEHLRAALASLLAQTYRDFALVLVDDASPDDTVAVARAVAAGDPRVEIHVNERRLGMLANTNRAWAISRERFPGAEYWALASDHDLWAPTWLERLVETLDARPEAVLAYPRTRRIDEQGREVSGPWRFDTAGVGDPRGRLRRSLRRMVSGDMIYGLFRASALDRTGFYRDVLAPDRLLLAEVALEGEFLQVPDVLWSRRFGGAGSLSRQRRVFWPDGGAPPSTYAPWVVTHALEYGRRHGTRAAVTDFLPSSAAFQLRSRAVRARNAVLVPPVRAAVRSPAGRRVVRSGVLPALRETREVLERLSEEAERR
jgi:glycosyltransferase involved in cell wall biosynthesis